MEIRLREKRWLFYHGLIQPSMKIRSPSFSSYLNQHILLSRVQIPLRSQSGSSLWIQSVAMYVRACHAMLLHRVKMHIEFALEMFTA